MRQLGRACFSGGRRTSHWQNIVVPCLRLNHTSQSRLSLSETLHALNVGVYKDNAKAVFWACLRADAWDTHARTQTKVIDGGIPLLRSALLRWYADKKGSRRNDLPAPRPHAADVGKQHPPKHRKQGCRDGYFAGMRKRLGSSPRRPHGFARNRASGPWR